MNPYKRPEKETDPSKLPGQIINRPPSPDTLQHNIKEWERYEKERNQTYTRCEKQETCVCAKNNAILFPQRRMCYYWRG